MVHNKNKMFWALQPWSSDRENPALERSPNETWIQEECQGWEKKYTEILYNSYFLWEFICKVNKNCPSVHRVKQNYNYDELCMILKYTSSELLFCYIPNAVSTLAKTLCLNSYTIMLYSVTDWVKKIWESKSVFRVQMELPLNPICTTIPWSVSVLQRSK